MKIDDKRFKSIKINNYGKNDKYFASYKNAAIQPLA